MSTALVNGVSLNYVQIEGGSGAECEDLVMVHGLATSLAFWYLQYAAVFSQRFRVTLFDLRGHGRSSMPPSGYTPPTLAADIAALMDHLHIGKAHVMAHSFGGVVAMAFGCMYPERVRSLVLADSHISAVRHVETRRDWLFGHGIQPVLDRHGLDLDTRDPYFGHKLLTRVAQMQMHSQPIADDLLGLVGPLMGKQGRRTAAQWLKLMQTTQAEKEMMGDDGLSLERLRGFKFPILAMYGDNSQARLTGGELLSVWPHAEFRRVRDAGHFFPTSRPEEVISGCLRFWGGEFTSAPRRHRAGEEVRSYFRSDRVFKAKGNWYFTTRESEQVGPFSEPEEAQDNLQRYMTALGAA